MRVGSSGSSNINKIKISGTSNSSSSDRSSSIVEETATAKIRESTATGAE